MNIIKITLTIIFPYKAVFDGAHMSSDMFTLYLHQNYIEFFQEIEDVVKY